MFMEVAGEKDFFNFFFIRNLLELVLSHPQNRQQHRNSRTHLSCFSLGFCLSYKVCSIKSETYARKPLLLRIGTRHSLACYSHLSLLTDKKGTVVPSSIKQQSLL